MYTVEVMPIQRGALRGTLSFFSRDAVPVGSVVTAPVRRRMLPCLVVAVTDVREQKLSLKGADFALKKLGTASPRQLFGADVMEALSRTALWHATTVGTVVSELVFSALLMSPRALATPKSRTRTESVPPEVLVLQAERSERVQAYKNLVRECFARDRSVVIVAPTIVEATELYDMLARGIETQTHLVTSLKGATDMRRTWDAVAESTAPLLLIGTPAVLTFPVAHLDALVVEREAARTYVSRTNVRLDLRRVAHEIALARGARLIYADFPVRVETYALLREGLAEDWARPQVRTQSPAVLTLVDVRATDEKHETRRKFSALQPQTYDALADIGARGGSALVYAARRGIAPLTVCNDCGTPVVDPTTDTPMVLHKTPRGNVFMSHRSGAVAPAERSCAYCGGWNLVSLGIGADRVYEEIRQTLPQVPVFLFTSDTARTHKAALKIIDEYQHARGGILVGTERMLPYTNRGASVVVVASIDSTLSLPTWRAHEHALNTLFALRARADERYIIETRRPESAVMKCIQNGSPVEFLRDELKERHVYGYPPFATFVGLEWSGTEAHCAKHKQLIQETCTHYDIVGPLPPEAQDRTRFVQRAVIRLSKNGWPDFELRALLDTLPPTVTITIDPDEIV
jgi:primosomal protein N' (replication factor Y) (superfamily II helicase)